MWIIVDVNQFHALYCRFRFHLKLRVQVHVSTVYSTSSNLSYLLISTVHHIFESLAWHLYSSGNLRGINHCQGMSQDHVQCLRQKPDSFSISCATKCVPRVVRCYSPRLFNWNVCRNSFHPNMSGSYLLHEQSMLQSSKCLWAPQENSLIALSVLFTWTQQRF